MRRKISRTSFMFATLTDAVLMGQVTSSLPCYTRPHFVEPQLPRASACPLTASFCFFQSSRSSWTKNCSSWSHQCGQPLLGELHDREKYNPCSGWWQTPMLLAVLEHNFLLRPPSKSSTHVIRTPSNLPPFAAIEQSSSESECPCKAAKPIKTALQLLPSH